MCRCLATFDVAHPKETSDYISFTSNLCYFRLSLVSLASKAMSREALWPILPPLPSFRSTIKAKATHNNLQSADTPCNFMFILQHCKATRVGQELTEVCSVHSQCVLRDNMLDVRHSLIQCQACIATWAQVLLMSKYRSTGGSRLTG